MDLPGFKTSVVSILFPVAEAGAGLDKALKQVCAEVDQAIADGATNIILSDRGVDQDHAPCLLYTSPSPRDS